MRHPRRLAILPLTALALAGCVSVSPAATPTALPGAPTSAPAASPAATSVPTATTAATTPAATPIAQVERAAWQTATLTDVRTGEAFTLADFAGKVVAIEPMAAWCVNCLHQQEEAVKALAAIDSEDIVYISLGIDPTELPEDLAAYAEVRGFDWRFVLADRDLLRQLAGEFGDQVLSPPSTPKILIGRDGTVTGPSFGLKDAEALEAELRAALG
jgi:cytochrome oxidase Cu insertion factor (SCO1/SenC/PrrC family)